MFSLRFSTLHSQHLLPPRTRVLDPMHWAVGFKVSKLSGLASVRPGGRLTSWDGSHGLGAAPRSGSAPMLLFLKWEHFPSTSSYSFRPKCGVKINRKENWEPLRQRKGWAQREPSMTCGYVLRGSKCPMTISKVSGVRKPWCVHA